MMATNHITQNIKLAFFQLGKRSGLFHISSKLYRDRLLILCYHGFEIEDEADFRPSLFMCKKKFENRLKIIKNYNFPVLPLKEGLQRLSNGTLPSNAICITIDDGFYSVLKHAAPLLKQYGFPATLYVTSYYVGKNAPIFRLVVQYMFWKTQQGTVDLHDQAWGGSTPVDLTLGDAAYKLAWAIIDYGENKCDETGRQYIAKTLGERLTVSYENIRLSRMLDLVNPDELKELSSYGIDVQLHTHRHRELGMSDRDSVFKEVSENRLFLERLLKQKLNHFCYPSGRWSKQRSNWLAEADIESATTCEPGLNTRNTPQLCLYRVLDGNQLPRILFEAELFGLPELLRDLTGKRKRGDLARQELQ